MNAQSKIKKKKENTAVNAGIEVGSKGEKIKILKVKKKTKKLTVSFKSI